MYSMVTIVDNTILYTGNLIKRVAVRCSHHQENHMLSVYQNIMLYTLNIYNFYFLKK